MPFIMIEERLGELDQFRDKLQFVNLVKRLVFDLTKISFLKCLTLFGPGISYCLKVRGLFRTPPPKKRNLRNH